MNALALALALFSQGNVEPIRVACIGDSITFGIGTQNPSEESYPAQLQRVLGPRYAVRNFGRSGAALGRETSLPYWNVPEFEAAKRFRPDIVVIMLGTNDCWPDNWKTSRYPFVPTYRALIEAFRSAGKSPRIFAAQPVPMYYGPENAAQQALERGVLPLVKQAARESGAELLDLFGPLLGKPTLFPDKLHPNKEGARLIAEAVYEALGEGKLPKAGWKVISTDSEQPGEGPARSAIDGDPSTYWHTAYGRKTPKHPHELVIDLGAEQEVAGFILLPRQIGVNGRIARFAFYTSLDGRSWGEAVAQGTLPPDSGAQRIRFDRARRCRYVKLVALSETNGGPWASLAELDLLKAAGGD